jgi:Cd(II)/Pb(II)-responsive transcriptional regulator
MRIGTLAKQTGCSVETIRYYERQGLLAPTARTEGNYRVYSDADVERLCFIRDCRSLDMTLQEIEKLLSFRDAPEEYCTDVNELLDGHIRHVTARIAELQTLEQQLHKLRRLCRRTQKAKNCGILKRLGKGNARARAVAPLIRRGC